MSRVELRHLRCFTAVAEHGHFGRAAASLSLSTPTVSQQVRSLEREIGADLLIRTPRGVGLTPAGVALLPYARRALRVCDDGASAARSAGGVGAVGPRIGVLHGAAPAVLDWLTDAVREVLPASRPTLRSASTTEQVRLLEAGELDIAMVRLPLAAPPDTVLTPVATEEIGVLLHATHPLAGRPVLRAAELCGVPLVWFPRDRAPGAHDATLSTLRAAGADVPLDATTLTMGQHRRTLELRPDAFTLGSERAAQPPDILWSALDGRPLHITVGVLWHDRPGTPLGRVTAELRRDAAAHFVEAPGSSSATGAGDVVA